MIKKISLVLFALWLMPIVALAQPGTWSLIGKAGDWKNTISGVGLGDNLYTIENSGALYVTGSDGVWNKVGKDDFANTKYFAAAGDKLYSIEKEGSFYQISPASGAWSRVGKEGEYVNTIACVGFNGKIYTVEASGALYVSSGKGDWSQIGGNDFANTKFLMSGGAKLYSIDKGGSLYEINPADGSRKMLGEKSEYASIIACVGLNGKIYSIDSNGALYVTEVSGAWKQIGKNDFANTKYIMAKGKYIYTIEKDGSLYQINVE